MVLVLDLEMGRGLGLVPDLVVLVVLMRMMPGFQAAIVLVLLVQLDLVCLSGC